MRCEINNLINLVSTLVYNKPKLLIYLVFACDVKFQLVLLYKLTGTILALGGLLSGVLETEEKRRLVVANNC